MDKLRGGKKEGCGNPLQYSCLENVMDKGAWWASAHRVAKSRTWLMQLSMLRWKRFSSIEKVRYLLERNEAFLSMWWIQSVQCSKRQADNVFVLEALRSERLILFKDSLENLLEEVSFDWDIYPGFASHICKLLNFNYMTLAKENICNKTKCTRVRWITQAAS